MNANQHVKQTLDGLDKMHEVLKVTEAMALAAVQAQATLALAYEARTANLIAMWANPESTLMDLSRGEQRTCGIGPDVVSDFLQQILERLGVAK